MEDSSADFDSSYYERRRSSSKKRKSRREAILPVNQATSSGHVQINEKYEGYLSEPLFLTKYSHVLVLFLHPYSRFGGKMQEPVVRSCHNAFAQLGYHSLSFNFTGVGKSKGSLDWWGNGDRAAAQETIRWGLENTTCTSVIIVGHSYGSLVGFSLLPELNTLVQGCVLISPPLGTWSKMAFGHLIEKGIKCKHPLFFVLGSEDAFTSLPSLKETMKKLKSSKSKALLVKNGTHNWEGMTDVVVDRVVEWVGSILKTTLIA